MSILFKIGLLVIILLVILQIWISHETISQGATLKKIDDLQAVLLDENLELANAIASSSAFQNIATRGASFGFSKPKALQYIH